MEVAMKNVILSLVVGALIMTGSTAFAEEPAVNVNPKLHPRLAEAQRLCRKAYNEIEEAQRAKEWDSEGHAQNAKELLDKVNNELKLAAKTVNAEKGK
jgi:hypothetical protein